jgi:hypothetical protein
LQNQLTCCPIHFGKARLPLSLLVPSPSLSLNPVLSLQRRSPNNAKPCSLSLARVPLASSPCPPLCALLCFSPCSSLCCWGRRLFALSVASALLCSRGLGPGRMHGGGRGGEARGAAARSSATTETFGTTTEEGLDQQLALSQPWTPPAPSTMVAHSTDRSSASVFRLAVATGAHSRSRGHSVAVHGGRRSRALLRSMGSCGATLGVDCLPRSVSGTGSLRRGPSFQLLQAVPPFGQAGHIQQEATKQEAHDAPAQRASVTAPCALAASEDSGIAACASVEQRSSSQVCMRCRDGWGASWTTGLQRHQITLSELCTMLILLRLLVTLTSGVGATPQPEGRPVHIESSAKTATGM